MSLPTVPAGVRLWLLKPSRNISKGDPLKDVHVTTEPKTDVLSLHHTTLCEHHTELHKRSI